MGDSNSDPYGLSDYSLRLPDARSREGSPVRSPPVGRIPVTDVKKIIDGRPRGETIDNAIKRAFEESSDGGIVYFPPGTYRFGIALHGRSCLTILGAGPCSVLEWEDTSVNIFNFIGCTDITIARLTFEGNNFLTRTDVQFRGLVNVQSCERFRVCETRWQNTPEGQLQQSFDAGGSPFPQRAGLHFFTRPDLHPEGGELDRPNVDVWVHNNEMDRYGIEVHDAKRVRISSNDIRRASGHGIWVGGDRRNGSILRDVVISDNNIVDPQNSGIAVADRSDGFLRDTKIQRVRVSGNRILKRALAVDPEESFSGIYVGPPPLASRENQVVDCVYQDIVVERNYCESQRVDFERTVDVGVHFAMESVPIRQLSDPDTINADPSFYRAVVRGNLIVGPWRFGLRLQNMRRSAVSDNTAVGSAHGLVVQGIAIEHNVLLCHIQRNRVSAVAEEYRLSNSLGLNVMQGDVSLTSGGARWSYESPDDGADDDFFDSDVRD